MAQGSSSSAASGGIGITGLLFVVFLTLKLIGPSFHTPVADWSWWWITAPLLGGVALLVIILIVAIIYFALSATRRK